MAEHELALLATPRDGHDDRERPVDPHRTLSARAARGRVGGTGTQLEAVLVHGQLGLLLRRVDRDVGALHVSADDLLDPAGVQQVHLGKLDIPLADLFRPESRDRPRSQLEGIVPGIEQRHQPDSAILHRITLPEAEPDRLPITEIQDLLAASLDPGHLPARTETNRRRTEVVIRIEPLPQQGQNAARGELHVGRLRHPDAEPGLLELAVDDLWILVGDRDERARGQHALDRRQVHHLMRQIPLARRARQGPAVVLDPILVGVVKTRREGGDDRGTRIDTSLNVHVQPLSAGRPSRPTNRNAQRHDDANVTHYLKPVCPVHTEGYLAS